MAKEYHTWDTVTKKTVLPSQADEYLRARETPGPQTLPKPKTIRVKYSGTCRVCHETLWPGASARWFGRGFITHHDCAKKVSPK